MGYSCVAGLDIGHSEIKIALCHIGDNKELNVLNVASSVTTGIDRGRITDVDALRSSLKSTLARVTQQKRYDIHSVVTTFPTFHTHFSVQSGFIHVNQDQPISNEHVNACIKRAKQLAAMDQSVMAHVIPIAYRVNGEHVENPVGHYGQNLEVCCFFIFAEKQALFLLLNMLKSLSLKVDGIIYDAMGTGQLLLDPHDRQIGAGLLDIGKYQSKLSFFKHGQIESACIIPIGIETYINDLSVVLKISPQHARLQLFNKPKTSISELATQVIDARHEELLALLSEHMPGFIHEPTFKLAVHGGVMHLPRFQALLQSTLGIKHMPTLSPGYMEIIQDQKYATSVGLVLRALEANSLSIHEFSTPMRTKIVKWFRDFF